ncbi:MAG: DUF2878 domain-containing protein [Pseudomonadota bacterium]
MQLDSWRRWAPNLILYHVVWFLAVDGAARGHWWWGPLSTLLFAAWQLPQSSQRRADLWLMLGAALIGFGLDTMWVRFHLMQYAAPEPWPGVAPMWIVALWVGFALTLNHSLYPLKTRLPWSAALGLTGGPLAYWLAQRDDHAVIIAAPSWIGLSILGLAWAIVTPLLLHAAHRLDSLEAH